MISGFLILAFLSNTNAQNTALKLEASFCSDVMRNFTGGIKTGNASVGLIDMSMTFNTKEAKLWNGGKLNIHGIHVSGDHPSACLTGDMQVLSNIDGLPNRFIYEFWYNHQIGNISFCAGLHNLNNDFYVSSLSANFINSSFGISPNLSLNNPISIFPTTTFGCHSKWETESVSLLMGIYNENHQLPNETGFNISDQLFKSGYYLITEAQIRSTTQALKHEYKLGCWYKKCNENHLHTRAECAQKRNYGIYFLIDQAIYQTISGKSISAFFQAGCSPLHYNLSSGYFAFGMTIRGYLQKYKVNEIGIAIASASINRFNELNKVYQHYTNETAAEATIQFKLHEKIIIQPDIQYIVNPASNQLLADAFIGLIRTKIIF